MDDALGRRSAGELCAEEWVEEGDCASFLYGWKMDFSASELEGDQLLLVCLCSGVAEVGGGDGAVFGGFFVSSFQCVTKFLYGLVDDRWGSECLLFLLNGGAAGLDPAEPATL